MKSCGVVGSIERKRVEKVLRRNTILSIIGITFFFKLENEFRDDPSLLRDKVKKNLSLEDVSADGNLDGKKKRHQVSLFKRW